MDNIEDKLIKSGGKLWENYNLKRIYFQRYKVMELLNLELEFYKTGNISCAWLNGKEISNTKARKIYEQIENDIYYNCKNGKFYYKNLYGIVNRLDFDIVKMLMVSLNQEALHV